MAKLYVVQRQPPKKFVLAQISSLELYQVEWKGLIETKDIKKTK